MRARNSADETVAVPLLPTTTEAAALAARIADSKSALDRQHDREHGRDRVARAGHVAHLHRIGRHVDRPGAARMKQHALLAQRHQHRLASDRAGQRVGRRRDLVAGVAPADASPRPVPCGSA